MVHFECLHDNYKSVKINFRLNLTNALIRCTKPAGGVVMRDLDTLVIRAKNDNTVKENLIRQYEIYILKCTSRICHRYITKSDDEWSISLIAFSQAIESYDLDKGSFLKFAELVIKRRLIDYSKSQGKYRSEVIVDPIVFDSPVEEEEEYLQLHIEIAGKISYQEDGDIKLEIEAINLILSHYGISFFDLSECSPHASKTRKACAKAVNYLLENPVLVHEMRDTRQLSLKIIEKNTKVPRKILERHRKYIIAAIEILTGDYPKIAEYLRYIREEGRE